jgi:putative oxidoreductase
MNILKCSCAKNWGDAAPLVLRIVAGLIFILHGMQKTADVSMFSGFLSALSVPAPSFFAWVVIVLEVGGGLALIFGFLTHWISKLLMVEMLVAVLLMYFVKGVFDQPALVLFAAAFSLMITGAGKWSVDTWMFKSCCGKCEDGVCPEHGGNTVVK